MKAGKVIAIVFGLALVGGGVYMAVQAYRKKKLIGSSKPEEDKYDFPSEAPEAPGQKTQQQGSTTQTGSPRPNVISGSATTFGQMAQSGQISGVIPSNTNPLVMGSPQRSWCEMKWNGGNYSKQNMKNIVIAECINTIINNPSARKEPIWTMLESKYALK